MTQRRVVRIAGLITVLAAALWFAGRSFPSWSQLLQALTHLNPPLVILAAAAETGSLWLFARQQQVLFAGFGVRAPISSVMAITYSRSAMSMTFPAGSVVSAVFAVQQFRRFGASRSTGVTVMVLSGLVSILGLGAMYAAWTGAVWSIGHPWTAVLVVIAVLGVVSTVTTAAHHRPPTPMIGIPRRQNPSGEDRMVRRATALLRTQLAGVKTLPGTSWATGTGLSAANWATDLACLALVSAGFGSPVSLAHLGLLYLGVQLLRQIPLSPGGIGVIEASLVAGLVLLGAGPAAAAGTTLVYRLLSCWLVIPVGLATWVALPKTAASRPVGSTRVTVRQATAPTIATKCAERIERPRAGRQPARGAHNRSGHREGGVVDYE